MENQDIATIRTTDADDRRTQALANLDGLRAEIAAAEMRIGTGTADMDAIAALRAQLPTVEGEAHSIDPRGAFNAVERLAYIDRDLASHLLTILTHPRIYAVLVEMATDGRDVLGGMYCAAQAAHEALSA